MVGLRIVIGSLILVGLSLILYVAACIYFHFGVNGILGVVAFFAVAYVVGLAAVRDLE